MSSSKPFHQPNRFFWCASYPLAAGSVVEAGNWGRFLKNYSQQTGGNPWVLVRELIFEDVRKRSFENAPSRLRSIFLCVSEGDINAFRKQFRPFDLCYEVELVDPGSSLHQGSWTGANLSPTDTWETLENKAKTYWTGNPSGDVEILTQSGIRIIKRL